MFQAMWKDTYEAFDGSEITDLIVDHTFSYYGNDEWYFVVIFGSGWKYMYLVFEWKILFIFCLWYWFKQIDQTKNDFEATNGST